MATVLVATGERQRSLGDGVRLPQAAGQQSAPPPARDYRASHRLLFSLQRLLHRLCKQWHSFSDTPGQGIRHAPKTERSGEPDREDPAS